MTLLQLHSLLARFKPAHHAVGASFAECARRVRSACRSSNTCVREVDVWCVRWCGRQLSVMHISKGR